MKQVLVIRNDLNMRKGKMVAQGAHASLGAANKTNLIALDEWKKGYNGIKICVYVNSEDELLQLHSKAVELGIVSYLVKDIGLTEFKEPTFTAVGIGPDTKDKVDQVTNGLPLL